MKGCLGIHFNVIPEEVEIALSFLFIQFGGGRGSWKFFKNLLHPFL